MTEGEWNDLVQEGRNVAADRVEEIKKMKLYEIIGWCSSVAYDSYEDCSEAEAFHEGLIQWFTENKLLGDCP